MQKLLFYLKQLLWKIFNRKDNLLNAEGIVCYICGTEALPLPLDPDEEKMLIEQAEKGSEFARSKLIEHNLRLVVYIAKKFESTGIEFEDLISIGSVGLIKAVKTFNGSKNIKLATYASRCIENEMLMQLRKRSKLKGEVSLEKPLCDDGEGNELVLADIIASEDDVTSGLDHSAEREAIWQILNRLERREQEIMILRFGLEGEDELTQKEVADKLGISQSYISRIEKKILVKMKKELAKIL